MTETRTLPGSVNEPTLYVAFELGKQDWKLAMTSGFGMEPWLRTVASGDLGAVERVLRAGRLRLGLPVEAPVMSCYEAGRDGFWIHRALTQLGVRNRVVDSASIEVNRRARRAKTDRLDALKLVRMLVRVGSGEKKVWSEVRVPTVTEEAARQVSRERTSLTQDQTRVTNQMRGWLATWGATLPPRRHGSWWASVRDWAGAALPAAVQARLARAEAHLAVIAGQIAALEGQQQAAVTAAAPTSPLRQLVQLKGVATTSASVLLDEGPGVARVSQSAPDRRVLGLCPDAVRQRGVDAGARHQSGWQCAPAIGQHSARVELGALATAERPSAVVSDAFWARQTRAADRDRRRGAQTGDRAVAICYDRGRAERRDRDRGVGSRRGVSRALRVRFVKGRADRLTATKRVPRHTCSGSRLHSLWGPRACARARIEVEHWVLARAYPDPREERRRVDRTLDSGPKHRSHEDHEGLFVLRLRVLRVFVVCLLKVRDSSRTDASPKVSQDQREGNCRDSAFVSSGGSWHRGRRFP